MNLLLAILLYFNSISSGQSYTWEEIEAISATQQQSIESVQQNQSQMLLIEQQHGEQAQLLQVQNRPVGY